MNGLSKAAARLEDLKDRVIGRTVQATNLDDKTFAANKSFKTFKEQSAAELQKFKKDWKEEAAKLAA